eukprot:COSAG01_NODE_56925_length_315_cov_1.041667_2_plen_68_part_01
MVRWYAAQRLFGPFLLAGDWLNLEATTGAPAASPAGLKRAGRLPRLLAWQPGQQTHRQNELVAEARH